MAYKEDHNLFVGGKYGSFKGLQCTFDRVLSKNLQNVKYVDSESHITVMKWGDEEERELLLATANQSIKVYDTEYKSYVESIPAKYGAGPICGVSRFNGVLVTAVQSGHIRVWTQQESNDIDIDPEDLKVKLNSSNEGMFGEDIMAGGNLSCMQHSQFNKNIIGSGGEGNDLKLWDLPTKQNIFSAKNLPDDAVRLAEPIWVSDLAFLAQNKTVAVCSRYGYVRLYDPIAQRKPVWSLKFPEQALTCMAVSKEYNLICGLAKGDMLMVDLRMEKLVHKYKGFLGAVRSVACHPTAPYIASASLDRHVRIHHRDTKELLVKEYLKLPIHCVVMRSDAVFTEDEMATRKSQKRKKTEEDKDLEEYDDMLNSLEKVEERSIKKIKKQEKSKKVLFVNPFASKQALAQKQHSQKNGLTSENSDESDEEEDDGLDGEEEEFGGDSDDDDVDDEEEEEEEEDDDDNDVDDSDSDCKIVD